MKLTRHQDGGRRFGRWLIGTRSTACRSQREKNAPTCPNKRLVILSSASALRPWNTSGQAAAALPPGSGGNHQTPHPPVLCPVVRPTLAQASFERVSAALIWPAAALGQKALQEPQSGTEVEQRIIVAA